MNRKLILSLFTFLYAIHLQAQTWPDKQRLDHAIDSIFGNNNSTPI